MKKCAFTVILLLSFLLVSCKSNEVYQPSEAREMHLAAVESISDDILYFTFALERSRLIYTDVETGLTGVLCGRPECEHKSTDCNGYLGEDVADFAICAGISEFEDKLYYVLNDGVQISLYQMKKDGSAHRKVRRLSDVADNSFPLSGGLQTIVHQGYVFAAGTVTDIVDGKVQIKRKLMAYPLDDLDEELTILSETVDSGYESILMMPAENKLYYGISKTELQEGETESSFQLMCWDIGNKTSEELFQGSTPDGLYEWAPDGENFIFTGAEYCGIYRLNLSEGFFETVGYFGGKESGFMTEYISDGKIIGFQYPDDGHLRIRAENTDGEEIVDCILAREDIESGFAGRTFLGMRGSKMYYQYISETGTRESLVMFDMESREQIILRTAELAE